MRTILTAVALATIVPAYAQDCGRYTSSYYQPGEVVATLKADNVLEIKDGFLGTFEFRLVPAKLGRPYLIAVPIQVTDDTVDELRVLKHKGDLIIDMMPYVPYCEK